MITEYFQYSLISLHLYIYISYVLRVETKNNVLLIIILFIILKNDNKKKYKYDVNSLKSRISANCRMRVRVLARFGE